MRRPAIAILACIWKCLQKKKRFSKIHKMPTNIDQWLLLVRRYFNVILTIFIYFQNKLSFLYNSAFWVNVLNAYNEIVNNKT